MMPTDEHAALLIETARAAGERILPFYRREHGVSLKADRSPVTDADIAAHAFILQELARHFPAIPVISEEDEEQETLSPNSWFFLVDPLDGTRSFVRGEDEFSVNIGLMHGSTPVFGVVDIPVRRLTYSGGVNHSPLRQHADETPVPIQARTIPETDLIITRSRSHPSARTEAFLTTLPPHEILPASSAIKLCWVAEGKADIYPRFGTTMEWDTAAGHAIVNAAGGSLSTPRGKALEYGKKGFENPSFIAWGKR